jgi:septal ring factor EnvC (AmiA/AmiB activator)
MTYSLDERATGNGIYGSNDGAHKGEQKLRQPKLNQTVLRAALATAQQEAAEARAALATAQQEAAEAQRRLDELRATLIDLRQERDAWRAQSQRLAEKRGKRPAWWQWGTGG